jgi:hypothetical protein
LPLSRCVERRVLIKAENAQPSTPSCSGNLSALTERRPIIVGQAFLLAVSLRQAGAPALKVSARRAHSIGRASSAEPGKDLRLDGSLALPKKFYRKLRFKLTALSSSAKYSAREISTAPN